MNRPKEKFYEPSVDEWAHEHYVEDLEKYCDGLEHKYEVLNEEYQANQKYIEAWDTTKDWYWKKIKQLERALDKACEDVATKVIKDVDNGEIVYMQSQILKEKYKSEYLMKAREREH